MKEIKLTQNKDALVDDEDYDFLMQWKWHARWDGWNWYASRMGEYINGKRKPIQMHRVILGIDDPKVKVDHRNHNGLDNQRSNMRTGTHGQNMMNKTSAKNGTSQYLGVGLKARSGRWSATIKTEKKTRHLGYFVYEIDAALAYNEAAKIYHGDRANLNIIDDPGLFQRLMSY